MLSNATFFVKFFAILSYQRKKTNLSRLVQRVEDCTVYTEYRKVHFAACVFSWLKLSDGIDSTDTIMFFRNSWFFVGCHCFVLL